MSERKAFHSLGALLRHYQTRTYYQGSNGHIAIYRFFRLRWFAPRPEGGYISTGRVTASGAGTRAITVPTLEDQP